MAAACLTDEVCRFNISAWHRRNNSSSLTEGQFEKVHMPRMLSNVPEPCIAAPKHRESNE
jgi:hypothetical protein